mmetsp:Transcript_20459/g.42895  ORF Transcript_20459/g.42895 Transcript_20459/m.42895 type:complete len:211 (-) Transcript_20459:425-1057(-)
MGKFDQSRNALPFSAFASAISVLTEHILASQKASQINSSINEVLSEEDMQLISQTMQGCHRLFPSIGGEGIHSSIDQGHGKDDVNRMQYAIRRFMKTVCSHLPVVFFIDDLQWADDSSLDLLLSLQGDVDINSLLLVGAYRDDELHDGHPLAIRLREVESVDSTIIKIALANLDQKTTQSMVAEVLRMEDREDDVNSLATIIYRKTGGNP